VQTEDNTEVDLKMDKGVDWTYMAQDRDQWWALVKMKMKLWIP
jgi:hypothetical protein